MTRSKKPKLEIDAAKHHAALIQEEGGSQYEYDPNLTVEECRRSGVRSMSGLFICYACQYLPKNNGKPHAWSSGKVCTELYLSKDKKTYRAVFNVQQCNECNRYGRFKVNENKYVDKVLDTFDLWTGRREALDSEHHESTGPHDSSRCYGCLKGICPANNGEGKAKKNRRRRRR